MLYTLWGWKIDETTTLSSKGSHPGKASWEAQRRKRACPAVGTRELPCVQSLEGWTRFEKAEMDKGGFPEKENRPGVLE